MMLALVTSLSVTLLALGGRVLSAGSRARCLRQPTLVMRPWPR
jgi:hypothetical protein